MEKIDRNKRLSTILIVGCLTMAILLVMSGCSKTNTANDRVVGIADDAVVILKEKLKKPSSLYIHKLVVSEFASKGSSTGLIIDGQDSDETTGFTYSVYIDYSAENNDDSKTRSFFKVSYYLLNDDKKLLGYEEINAMPELSGVVYEIDKSQLHSYSDTLK